MFTHNPEDTITKTGAYEYNLFFLYFTKTMTDSPRDLNPDHELIS